ncbi:MAG: hypothetical protein IJC64_04150 [Clostridia bacterium]|nr:hypothetical protein [Clostridia bacterium]
MLIFNITPVALYIDPTAITTSLVSASSIIIALGASASVLLGRATTLSAAASAKVTKLTRGFVNAFCIVENGGKSVEREITLKKKR